MKDLKRLIEVLKELMVILTPSQKKWGLVVFCMSLFGAIVETLGVSVILPLAQVMLEPEKLLNVEIVYKICSMLNMTSANQVVVLVAIGVILVYIIKNAYLCFLSYVRVKYSAKVQRELSVRILESYMQRGYSFFRINNTSKLLRGINGAVAGLYTIIYHFMRIIAELLTIICIFVLVVFTDWRMAVSIVALVGVCLVLILSVFKGSMEKSGKQYYKQLALVNKWSMQLFSGIKEVLVLNRKDFFVDNYITSYGELQDARVKQTVANESPGYIIEGACVAGIIAVVCVRVGSMPNPAEYIPQLAVFAMAAFRLLPSVGRVSSYISSCIFNLPAVDEVYRNIADVEQYAANSDKQKVRCIESEEELQFNHKLEIKDIVWRYPDGEENVLDRVSLTVNKGQSVAFVGPSGAGKSTLADIVLGLFQPQEGSVLIDGVNVLNNRTALSKFISFVPQSVYLIDDTIRRNVAFGINDEDISDEAVWSALEQAQMKAYIESLPLGLETVVGERGIRFSGGQAQRLAIARALYTNPEILVLDEATSALDTETETAVMEAIEALQGQKTMIIIAHRLTTIKNCDKIYEIANGKIRERKYEEL